MRSDKTARNYHAAFCLAAALRWLNTGFGTAQPLHEHSCHALIEARRVPVCVQARPRYWA
jgi:hypothetical protein